MPSYLNKEEFVPYAPDGIDEQVNVNHENCPAGLDTKKRLYIKRVENNGIIAYCQHCGERGVAFSGAIPSAQYLAGYAQSINAKQTDGGIRKGRYNQPTIPRDADTDVNKWPPKARVWIRKYQLTAKEISDNGIFYSGTLSRVGIPTWLGSKLRHISYRRIFDTDKGPKYTTIGSNVASVHAYSGLPSVSGGAISTIIITEDKLSAIKCARVADALCLNGVYLTDSSLLSIIKKYSKVIVFLDDDNRQVKLNEIVIKNRVEQFGKHVKIVHSAKQPKELTTQELEDLL